MKNKLNSSKNKTPLWARVISPAFGIFAPPPIKETSLAEWWGDLKGLLFINFPLSRSPITE